MTDGEEKLVEIMSLMLDEQRGMRQEQRGMRDEQRETRKEIQDLKRITNERLGVVNDRLEAIEYALTVDSREFRNRMERVESRIAKLEDTIR